ncbi:hypothetical protein CCH79_00003904 [Gambusia affinis]|uniref:Uncharacterized protein n=1 Tax=Gambusia affinis TaxID=33528 RepID=A0A315VBG0_GAMAF|nr:hypothetical protein CCH79_00003904 [Gambusia affinis]
MIPDGDIPQKHKSRYNIEMETGNPTELPMKPSEGSHQQLRGAPWWPFALLTPSKRRRVPFQISLNGLADTL